MKYDYVITSTPGSVRRYRVQVWEDAGVTPHHKIADRGAHSVRAAKRLAKKIARRHMKAAKVSGSFIL